MIQDARIDPDPLTVDFTTQNPAVSCDEAWVHIDQQIKCLDPSRVQASRDKDGTDFRLVTTNVAALRVDLPSAGAKVTIDGQVLSVPEKGDGFERIDGQWRAFDKSKGDLRKWDACGGPFKSVYNNRFLFVIGTTGTPEENRWAADRARYDAETMLYRGNGSVDVVTDRDYSPRRYRGRNVILYGNADTNEAWKTLLKGCPVQVHEGAAIAGKTVQSAKVGGLLVYPIRGSSALVAAVTGSGIDGMRSTDRLSLFTSGVAYPDWILFDPDKTAGILADGFFDNEWKLDPSQSAWCPG
jgi:hypothetical protein